MILAPARDLWTRLALVPIEFPPAGDVAVRVSPDSLLCPPGWTGIVVLGESGIATAPDEAAAAVLRTALRRLPATAATDPARIRAELPVTDLLGPATLAYLDPDGLRMPGGIPAERHSGGLDALLDAAPADDVAESGMHEIQSDAFVIRDGRRIVAAAGYQRWLDPAAHLCVLTAPSHRGRGLARTVAAAATADAVANGLLPQWRAQPQQSRRVARALGFRELGTQISITW